LERRAGRWPAHGSKTIYFYPVALEGDLSQADFILISHGHADHADLESLKKIGGRATILIISPNVQGLYQADPHGVGVVPLIMKEGDAEKFDDITVEAVPACDDQFNLRSTEGAGFVVSIDGERIYFAGGTRMFPEMADIVSDATLYP
jgi:L-ascorbate metabolism protein UlaG (beta-lactamase superfamily)